ncbi:hypothetical protein ACFSVM_25775 [Paenibacillus shunpengii]|uniref:Uncharacterized protein n=1 Tax=Paenibacillus shunpengii TaxID=2054424 RepID=A0ABW5SXE6_9BACL
MKSKPVTTDQNKLLREKNLSSEDPKSEVLIGKAEKEIERLTIENDRLKKETEALKINERVLNVRVESMREELETSQHTADRLQAELNRMKTDIPLASAPETEASILDTAIHDLTRARWILERLHVVGD